MNSNHSLQALANMCNKAFLVNKTYSLDPRTEVKALSSLQKNGGVLLMKVKHLQNDQRKRMKPTKQSYNTIIKLILYLKQLRGRLKHSKILCLQV